MTKRNDGYRTQAKWIIVGLIWISVVFLVPVSLRSHLPRPIVAYLFVGILFGPLAFC